MDKSIIVLLQLVLAHVLTDFVFQPISMVKHKREHRATSWMLYLHVGIAGFLTYLFLQQWTNFWIPLFILVTHYLIDLWKIQKGKDDIVYFVLDQAAHLIMIVIAWLWVTGGFAKVIPSIVTIFGSAKWLAVIIGYILVMFPVGFIIGRATERWQKEIATAEESSSLKKAGRYIGIFERILVLTFILTNNFAAIGFLIGAKSILRFSDSQGGRKQTEYVLIGTLMSFAICISIGIVVRAVLLMK